MSAKESPPGGYRRAESESRAGGLDSGQFTRRHPICPGCTCPASRFPWLHGPDTTPADWRFAWAVHGVYGPMPPEVQRQACIAFAETYGDAALIGALRKALSVPASPGVDLSLCRGLLARLEREVAS